MRRPVAFRGYKDVFRGRLGFEALSAGHTQAILPLIPTKKALVAAQTGDDGGIGVRSG
jgi:hypothetical protein